MTLERHYSGGPEGANVGWRGVRQLWEQQLLCDVRLVAEGTVFKVHRCYLASCCQYFHAMFTQGFKQSTEVDVHMPGVTAKGLHAVLQYMYTGTISITPNSIKDVLQTASFVQVEDVLTICGQYLKDCLKPDNIMDTLKLTEFYAMNRTSDEIMNCISKNYLSFSQAKSFLKNCNIDMLCQLLSADTLCAESEYAVFQSVVCWLTLDPERTSCARRVLKLVRFGLMKEEDMDLLKAETIFLQAGCEELQQKALEYHQNIHAQPSLDSIVSWPRSSAQSLVVIKQGDKDMENKMVASPLAKNELVGFSPVGPIGPLVDTRLFVGVAVVNNFLFFAGGITLDDEEPDTVFRYNPTKAEWLQLAPMNCPHHNFSLVGLSDGLMAVGGVYTDEEMFSVEKYSFKENIWTKLPHLRISVFGNAGCAHNGCVYITGGIYRDPAEPDDVTDDVHCFEPGNDRWIKKSGMNRARIGHTMVPHRERIVVCGGFGDAYESILVLETEMYDVETDQWSVVASMPVPRTYAIATCNGSHLYLVGGEGAPHGEERNIILRFDMEAMQWNVLHHSELGDADSVAAFLKIPREMYQMPQM